MHFYYEHRKMRFFTEGKKFEKKNFFQKKIFFRQNFYQKIVKGGHHWQKNMIPTLKFRFPSSMTSQIAEKRKIAIFRKSDLYFGGHMTSWWRHSEKFLWQNAPRQIVRKVYKFFQGSVAQVVFKWHIKN